MPASDPATTPDAPGVVLALLQMSESMGRGMSHSESMTKLRAACVFLDYLLDSVAAAPGRRGGVGPFLSVVGYTTREDGEPAYYSLLPGTDAQTFWVDAATLAEMSIPPRRQGPRRWIDAQAAGGGRTTAAFGLAHRILGQQLAHRPADGPVLLIHCGDGSSDDGLPSLEVRSLLALAAGPRGEAAALMNGIFREDLPPSLDPPPIDSPLRGVWEASSPLPGPGDDRRAFSINMWPRRILHRLLFPRKRPPLPSREPIADAPALSLRAMSLAKRGNSDEQWEDAYAADPGSGVVVVGDGASEGIFVKSWANILCRHFVAERPRLEDPAALDEWLKPCRQEWIAEIGYPDQLNWSQKRKVPEVGGAATLLTLEVRPATEAGPEADPFRWKAVAVGDSCLFLIRDGRLLLSFPMIAARDFGRAPALLRTLGQAATPNPLVAAGPCRPGDLFILATDAVSQWLFRSHEEGIAVDWPGLWDADPDAWAGTIEAERDARRIVNDDCTLVLVRVDAPENP